MNNDCLISDLLTKAIIKLFLQTIKIRHYSLLNIQ